PLQQRLPHLGLAEPPRRDALADQAVLPDEAGHLGPRRRPAGLLKGTEGREGAVGRFPGYVGLAGDPGPRPLGGRGLLGLRVAQPQEVAVGPAVPLLVLAELVGQRERYVALCVRLAQRGCVLEYLGTDCAARDLEQLADGNSGNRPFG